MTVRRKSKLRPSKIYRATPPPPAKRKPKRESPELSAARYEVVARSGGMCEAGTPGCPDGTHRGHHAHHVVLRSQEAGHSPDKLLWVCLDGHTWIHANPEEAYQRGWLAHASVEEGDGLSFWKPGFLDG